MSIARGKKILYRKNMARDLYAYNGVLACRLRLDMAHKGSHELSLMVSRGVQELIQERDDLLQKQKDLRAIISVKKKRH